MLSRKLLGPVRCVLPNDPAVDRASYDEYKASHYDYSKLKITEGMEPSVFVCMQPTPHQIAVANVWDGLARKSFLVRCCWTATQNYEIENPDGSTRMLGDPPRTEDLGNSGKVVSGEWFGQCGIHPDDIEELGDILLDVSRARPIK